MANCFLENKALYHWLAATNEKAADVPVINRSPTGHQTPLNCSSCSLVRFKCVVLCPCSGRVVQDRFLCCLGIEMKGRAFGAQPRSFSLRHAQPGGRRTGPARSRPGSARPRTRPKVCSGFGFCIFPDMPCMKRVYRDKKAALHWSAARTKERSSSR